MNNERKAGSMRTPTQLQTLEGVSSTDERGGVTVFIGKMSDDAWYDFFGVGMRGKDIKAMVERENDLPAGYFPKH